MPSKNYKRTLAYLTNLDFDEIIADQHEVPPHAEKSGTMPVTICDQIFFHFKATSARHGTRPFLSKSLLHPDLIHRNSQWYVTSNATRNTPSASARAHQPLSKYCDCVRSSLVLALAMLMPRGCFIDIFVLNKIMPARDGDVFPRY